MSFTWHRSPSGEVSASTGKGVIVRDAVPYTKSDGDAETCASCPTVFEWCVKDALGVSCSFIAYLLFLYGYFVMVFVILIPRTAPLVNLVHLVILHWLVMFALSAYCRTMFSNPGAGPLNDATPEKLSSYSPGTIVYRCTVCRSIKPPRTHHCRICQRCIKRMDHHCIFVNNCVGQNNQKSFILFTFYTCVLSIYTLILLYTRVPTCIASNWTACPAWSPPVTLLFTILLALAAFSFAIFTAIMTGIQLYCIYTDTTGIEFYKGKRLSHRKSFTSFLSSLKTVFGASVGFSWLNPMSRPVLCIAQSDERIAFNI